MSTHRGDSILGDNVSVVTVSGGDGPLVFLRADDAAAEFRKLVLATGDVDPEINEALFERAASGVGDASYWSRGDAVISIVHTTLIVDDNREEG